MNRNNPRNDRNDRESSYYNSRGPNSFNHSSQSSEQDWDREQTRDFRGGEASEYRDQDERWSNGRSWSQEEGLQHRPHRAIDEESYSSPDAGYGTNYGTNYGTSYGTFRGSSSRPSMSSSAGRNESFADRSYRGGDQDYSPRGTSDYGSGRDSRNFNNRDEFTNRNYGGTHGNTGYEATYGNYGTGSNYSNYGSQDRVGGGRMTSNTNYAANSGYGSNLGSDYGSGAGSNMSSANSYQPQSSYSGRGPKSYKRTDDRIKEDVCDLLTRNHYIDAHEIDVEVKDAEVTLSGTVPDRRMKHLAEDVAESCYSVKDVVNNLRVKKDEMSASSSMSNSDKVGGEKSAGKKSEPPSRH